METAVQMSLNSFWPAHVLELFGEITNECAEIRRRLQHIATNVDDINALLLRRDKYRMDATDAYIKGDCHTNDQLLDQANQCQLEIEQLFEPVNQFTQQLIGWLSKLLVFAERLPILLAPAFRAEIRQLDSVRAVENGDGFTRRVLENDLQTIELRLTEINQLRADKYGNSGLSASEPCTIRAGTPPHRKKYSDENRLRARKLAEEGADNHDIALALTGGVEPSDGQIRSAKKNAFYQPKTS